MPAPKSNKPPAAFAIAAHPDDIEFYMAGTLLLLKKGGYQIHYMTVANGSCGSLEHSAATTRRIRKAESQNAAKLLGATFHESLTNDLEIVYELKLLRRLAAVIRRVEPNIILTHSPQDYMEDHINTARLAATGAFARGMPNFSTVPRAKAVSGNATIYHAMPHGLCDPLRRPIIPESFVDTASIHALKRKALAAHQSQKRWLDASQGMDSYLKTMDDFSLQVGRMSGRFQHAEGWRRRLHLGFCEEAADPLQQALGEKYWRNPQYLS